MTDDYKLPAKPGINKTSRIYIAGHRGLVGSALFRALREKGYTHRKPRTSNLEPRTSTPKGVTHRKPRTSNPSLRECPQPMKEEYLLTGPLEATNRPYAVAKIAGRILARLKDLPAINRSFR